MKKFFYFMILIQQVSCGNDGRLINRGGVKNNVNSANSKDFTSEESERDRSVQALSETESVLEWSHHGTDFLSSKTKRNKRVQFADELVVFTENGCAFDETDSDIKVEPLFFADETQLSNDFIAIETKDSDKKFSEKEECLSDEENATGVFCVEDEIFTLPSIKGANDSINSRQEQVAEVVFEKDINILNSKKRVLTKFGEYTSAEKSKAFLNQYYSKFRAFE